MAVLGTHAVTLLSNHDRLGLKAGDIVEAQCYLGTDAYQPYAEVVTASGHSVGIGRMDRDKSWRFVDEEMQNTYQRFAPKK